MLREVLMRWWIVQRGEPGTRVYAVVPEGTAISSGELSREIEEPSPALVAQVAALKPEQRYRDSGLQKALPALFHEESTRPRLSESDGQIPPLGVDEVDINVPK